MNIVGRRTMNVEIGYDYDEVIDFSVFGGHNVYNIKSAPQKKKKRAPQKKSARHLFSDCVGRENFFVDLDSLSSKNNTGPISCKFEVILEHINFLYFLIFSYIFIVKGVSKGSQSY